MALTKSTSKTKSTAKTDKTVSPAIAFIRKIELCVEKDNATLAKAYPKSLAELEKEIKRTHKAIEQSKKQSKKIGKSKPVSSDKKAVQPSDILNQTLSLLKNHKAVLLAGHKKFLALQKSALNFEKAWAKKMKQIGKPKKKSKKDSSDMKKASATEASFEQQPENKGRML